MRIVRRSWCRRPPADRMAVPGKSASIALSCVRFDGTAQTRIARHSQKSLCHIAFSIRRGFCRRGCKVCTSRARGAARSREMRKRPYFIGFSPQAESRAQGGWRRSGVLPLCPEGSDAVTHLVFLPVRTWVRQLLPGGFGGPDNFRSEILVEASLGTSRVESRGPRWGNRVARHRYGSQARLRGCRGLVCHALPGHACTESRRHNGTHGPATEWASDAM